jgi:hypothetical protein
MTVEHCFDELQVVQSRRGVVMRAARLHKANQIMDYASIESEAFGVFSQLASETELRKFKSVREVASAVVLSHTHYGAGLSSLAAVQHRLVKAREDAGQLRRALAELESSPQQQEELLVKHFVAHAFTGYTRSVISRYLLGRGRSQLGGLSSAVHYYHVTSLVLLPACAAAMVYVTWAFIESMGSRSTAFWLLVYILTVAQSVFVVQPVMIAVTWLVLNRGPSEEARRVWESLSRHAVLLLRRSFGLLRDCDAMVQHFNPACRVARLYPGLPVSRLLMSVNDADLQRFGIPHRSGPDVPGAWLLCEPAVVQTVLEVGASIVLDLGLVLLYMAGRFSVGLLVGVLIVLTLAVLHFGFDAFSTLRAYWHRYDPKVHVYKEDFYIDDDMPLRHTAAPSKVVCALRTLRNVPASSSPAHHVQSWARSVFSLRSQPVTLRDNKEVLVPVRLARHQPLGDISQMNRAFQIESPADLDLMKAMLVRAALTKAPEETKHEGSRFNSNTGSDASGAHAEDFVSRGPNIKKADVYPGQHMAGASASPPRPNYLQSDDASSTLPSLAPSQVSGPRHVLLGPPLRFDADQGNRWYAEQRQFRAMSVDSIGSVSTPSRRAMTRLKLQGLQSKRTAPRNRQSPADEMSERYLDGDLEEPSFLPEDNGQSVLASGLEATSLAESTFEGELSLWMGGVPNEDEGSVTETRNRPLAFMQKALGQFDSHQADEDLMSVLSYTSGGVLGTIGRSRSPLNPARYLRYQAQSAQTMHTAGRVRAVPRKPAAVARSNSQHRVGPIRGPGSSCAECLAVPLADQLSLAAQLLVPELSRIAEPAGGQPPAQPAGQLRATAGRSSRSRKRGAKLAQLQQRDQQAPAAILPEGQDWQVSAAEVVFPIFG